MFVWRDDEPKVTVGGVNLTPYVSNVGIYTERSACEGIVPVYNDEMCECDKCKMGSKAVFHSMCDVNDPCCPECEGTATPEQELTEWWVRLAETEVERTVPKAIEYSATDLTDIGHDLARTAGREVDDEEAAELGVFFYLRGKMARWVGAVIAGQRVSDDTLFDIGVYVRMAQRIREKGSWPGTIKAKEEES
jgi:hypothetical protein